MVVVIVMKEVEGEEMRGTSTTTPAHIVDAGWGL